MNGKNYKVPQPPSLVLPTVTVILLELNVCSVALLPGSPHLAESLAIGSVRLTVSIVFASMQQSPSPQPKQQGGERGGKECLPEGEKRREGSTVEIKNAEIDLFPMSILGVTATHT